MIRICDGTNKETGLNGDTLEAGARQAAGGQDTIRDIV